MLSIFLFACWPSVCLLWRDVYLGLLPIFFFNTFIYFILFLAVLGLHRRTRALSGLRRAGATPRRHEQDSYCGGLSRCRARALEHSLSSCAQGPSCSGACGIFPDQSSNPCPLHWKADSQPLHHQGSPCPFFDWVICFFDIELYELFVYFGC